MTSAQDVQLVDKNLIGMYRHFDIKNIKIGGTNYYLLNNKCESPLWNMICLTEAVSYPDIEEMESIFKAQNAPFTWWVDTRNISADMAKHFQKSEYIFFGDITGMVFNLEDYQSGTNKNPSTINIRKINDKKDFIKWAEVLSECFEFTEDVSKYIAKN